MKLEEIREYLKINKIEFDSTMLAQLTQLKQQAVDALDEELANRIWCYEQIYKIQEGYVKVFTNLKSNKYSDAWRGLERIDIELSSLRENYPDYSNDEFNLLFIESIIREYEKLFPYHFFMSREAIIKKESCSICGQINTIRNHCSHEVGKLYMGGLCCREVEDIEFIGWSIVENPFDKYAVLFPQDKEYNYFMLEELMPLLRNPYERWYVDIIKEKNPIYKNIGRNDKCPCNSGKKYKKCCLDTEQEYIEHHRITLLDNPSIKQTPIKLGNTWKE